MSNSSYPRPNGNHIPPYNEYSMTTPPPPLLYHHQQPLLQPHAAIISMKPFTKPPTMTNTATSSLSSSFSSTHSSISMLSSSSSTTTSSAVSSSSSSSSSSSYSTWLVFLEERWTPFDIDNQKKLEQTLSLGGTFVDITDTNFPHVKRVRVFPKSNYLSYLGVKYRLSRIMQPDAWLDHS